MVGINTKFPKKAPRDRARWERFLERFRVPVVIILVKVAEIPGCDPSFRPVSLSEPDHSQSVVNALQKALNRLSYMLAVISFLMNSQTHLSQTVWDTSIWMKKMMKSVQEPLACKGQLKKEIHTQEQHQEKLVKARD